MITSTSAEGIGHIVAKKGVAITQFLIRALNLRCCLFCSSGLVACLFKAGLKTMLCIGIAFLRSTAKVSGGLSRKLSGGGIFQKQLSIYRVREFLTRRKCTRTLRRRQKGLFLLT